VTARRRNSLGFDPAEWLDMQVAGGFVGVVAGVYGIIAALFTLVPGHGDDLTMRIGLGGAVFSFLVLLLGAPVVGEKIRGGRLAADRRLDGRTHLGRRRARDCRHARRKGRRDLHPSVHDRFSYRGHRRDRCDQHAAGSSEPPWSIFVLVSPHMDCAQDFSDLAVGQL
jgi:hypothetical protein